jgi:uncharacterized protein
MARKNTGGAGISNRRKPLFMQANKAWDKGNLQLAFNLFMQSAESGDRGSQLDLGYFFDNGLSVKRDKKMALHWYRKAYLQGDAGAANNIATVYRNLGDTKKMLWWFRRAAEMGDIDVLFDMAKRYETGTMVPKNACKAKAFYRRVISCEHATSEEKAQAKARLSQLG